jgi:hypothetical protein|tara:strand:+ start:594 stop:722 length:129 start_codon:yes stop_codon:yes gene_type:complete
LFLNKKDKIICVLTKYPLQKAAECHQKLSLIDMDISIPESPN